MSTTPPARIVLVGFMGAGKSTVGPILASRLGWDFVDTDCWIEGRAGARVAELFRTLGEPGFRRLEGEAADELRGRARTVVAAGGGSFAVPGTREALQDGSRTVWLRCDLETAIARLKPDGSRPLASDRETMSRLFAERERLYRLADVSVDTVGWSPESVAARVEAAVFQGQAVSGAKER